MNFANIKGCFLGLAVGDALGVPVEFRDRSFFKNHPVKEMLGYGTWNQPPGTWSDDSSLTFCTAESLTQGYDPEDIGKKFVAWYTDGYWGAHHKLFDIGATTRFSIARIKSGERAEFAGALDEDSNGNGSLMRIAPASLYFCDLADEELFERISEVSSITHGHFRSVFSCFVFSKYVIELLKGHDKVEALKIAAGEINAFAQRKQFNETEMSLFRRILNHELIHAKEDSIGSSGYVVHTLEAALWCFLTTSTFEAAVLRAVNLGADTDTTACVTGALAGLFYGDDSIPLLWRIRLAREKDIIKLAEGFTDSLKNRILVKK